MKAFETPSLRAALETAKDKLLESQENYETMRTKCSLLEEQMVSNENFFTTHQLALKESNECELEKSECSINIFFLICVNFVFQSLIFFFSIVIIYSYFFSFKMFCLVKLALRETKKSAQEQIQALQYELNEINQQNAETLKSCQMKADRRSIELETLLKLSRDRELELVERLNNFTVTENQLRDKVQASEQEFSERLIAVTARERELNEKVTQLTQQFRASEDKRYALEEKLKLARDETNILRQRRNCVDQSIPNGGASVQIQTVGNKSIMLEEEVLSLRSVLDMKLNEISELRKQNQSMVQAQDELPKAQLKISILESRLEDLTIQLKTKVEEEQ